MGLPLRPAATSFAGPPALANRELEAAAAVYLPLVAFAGVVGLPSSSCCHSAGGSLPRTLGGRGAAVAETPLRLDSSSEFRGERDGVEKLCSGFAARACCGFTDDLTFVELGDVGDCCGSDDATDRLKLEPAARAGDTCKFSSSNLSKPNV